MPMRRCGIAEKRPGAHARAYVQHLSAIIQHLWRWLGLWLKRRLQARYPRFEIHVRVHVGYRYEATEILCVDVSGCAPKL